MSLKVKRLSTIIIFFLLAPISLAYAKDGAYVLIHYEHEAGQVDTGGFGEGISQEFSSLAYCELAAKTILQKLSYDGKTVEKTASEAQLKDVRVFVPQDRNFDDKSNIAYCIPK